MNDSTLATKPLYGTSRDQPLNTEAAQLYFGPGFEDRLEEEFDQYVYSGLCFICPWTFKNSFVVFTFPLKNYVKDKA